MKASQVLQALLLAAACLPVHAQPQAGALADADLLYCAQAYAEGGVLLKADPDAGVRRTGRDALRRSRVLGARDIDLLNADPARHKHASLLARQRLAAMPAAPLEARRLALRAAYLECRYLQAAAPAASVTLPPGSEDAATLVARDEDGVTLDDLASAAAEETLVPAASEHAASGSLSNPASASPSASTAAATAAPSAVATAVPATSPHTGADTDAGANDARGSAPHTTSAPATSAVTTPAPVPASTPRATPSPAAAPQPSALSDADALYCEQVYGEVATLGDRHADAAAAARDARERWRPLNERDIDLLNENPARHSRATASARQRLAALPDAAGRARDLALRTAYEECRRLEDRATAAPAPVTATDRVRMLANRRFCRDLMQNKLKVSPKLRAAFTPGELSALNEIEKIAAALAQPMPGAPLTLEQDREANQLQAQLRDTLDQAVANRSDAKDPVVLALGQCHEDYVQGLLGGPDVLSAARDDTPEAAATISVAAAPVVRMADLGPVFHMRETTPAGSFDAIWFRRGQGNVYDGVWVQAGSGQLQRDVLELRGIVDGELTLYRQSYRGSYRARVRPDGRLAPGAASWFNSAAYSWGPLPAQHVRGGNLGALVHMREVTPYGNYEGLWRQRGVTGIYDVVWVFLPTGELTSDVLAVTGMVHGQLIIRRVNAPGLFALKRRSDAMAYKDPASGGKVMSKWEVVPAQAVRLGDAVR